MKNILIFIISLFITIVIVATTTQTMYIKPATSSCCFYNTISHITVATGPMFIQYKHGIYSKLQYEYCSAIQFSGGTTIKESFISGNVYLVDRVGQHILLSKRAKAILLYSLLALLSLAYCYLYFRYNHKTTIYNFNYQEPNYQAVVYPRVKETIDLATNTWTLGFCAVSGIGGAIGMGSGVSLGTTLGICGLRNIGYRIRTQLTIIGWEFGLDPTLVNEYRLLPCDPIVSMVIAKY